MSAVAMIEEASAKNAELITCLRGAEAPLEDRAVHDLLSNGVELELYFIESHLSHPPNRLSAIGSQLSDAFRNGRYFT